MTIKANQSEAVSAAQDVWKVRQTRGTGSAEQGRNYGIARTIFIVSTLSVQTRWRRSITGSLWSAKR